MADAVDPTLADADPKGYLNAVSEHSARLGDTTALHPDFATRMAGAIRDARAAGLPVRLSSGFREPGDTGSNYDASGMSMHGYGVAADVDGIGAVGSPTSRLWANIATAHGLHNPYGINNPAEYNHWQLVSDKLENNPAMQSRIAAAKGDPVGIWNAVSPIKPPDTPRSDTPVADALKTSVPANLPPSHIAQLLAAYQSGKMPVEDRADFEKDVNAGKIVLPVGLRLGGAASAPKAGAFELPQEVVDAYNSAAANPYNAGAMPTDARKALDRDLASGEIKLPSGAILNQTYPNMLDNAKEMVTGAQRSTDATRNLPELGGGSQGLFNGAGIPPAKAALAATAILTTTDPAQIAKILTSTTPNIGITQDEKGNLIAENKKTGAQFIINKPGISPLDIVQGAGLLAAFTPAGRAATVGGAAVANMATQAGLEVVKGAAGGDVSGTDIAVAGGVGAGTALLGKGIKAGVAAIRPNPAAATVDAAGAAPASDITQGIRQEAKTGPIQGPEAPIDLPNPLQPPPDGPALGPQDTRKPFRITPETLPNIRDVPTDIPNPIPPREPISPNPDEIPDFRRPPARPAQGPPAPDWTTAEHATEALTRANASADAATAARAAPKAAETVAPVASAEAVAAPAAKAAAEAPSAVEAVAGAAGKPVAAAPIEDLVTASRTAARGVQGAEAAKNFLIEQAAPDAGVVSSAKRLGVLDDLQPDHITTNQTFREFMQGLKSVIGSKLKGEEMTGLQAVGNRATSAIEELGGSTDLSSVSGNVKNALLTAQQTFDKAGEALYAKLKAAIPAKADAPASTVLAMIQKRADDLGGSQYLSSMEKSILGKLSPKVTEVPIAKPPEVPLSGRVTAADYQNYLKAQQTAEQAAKATPTQVLKQPTYALLDDVRKNLGMGLKHQGPFKDQDIGMMKHLYAGLLQDQKIVAAQHGMADTFDAARKAVQMRKGIENDLTRLFGKQVDGSILTKLSTAIKSAAEGNDANIVKLLRSVPENMRQNVVASGLATAFGKATRNGDLNFNTYAKWYEGLQKNKAAMAAIMTNLPPEARTMLKDIYNVSDGIRKATAEFSSTGKSLQARDLLLKADSFIDKMYQIAQNHGKKAVGAAIGHLVPGVGPALGAMLGSALEKPAAKGAATQAVDNLFRSPEFKSAIFDYAGGKATSPQVAARISRTHEFTKFARAVNNRGTTSDRENFALSLFQAGANERN